MNSPRLNSSRYGFIEPLEARIAPANLIFVGGSGLEGANPRSQYVEAISADNVFVDTNGNVGDQISAVVGTTTANFYYIKLVKGDILNFGGTNPYISAPNGKPLTGTVVAFFVDLNGNNEVDKNELMGLSLGKNSRVQVTDVVYGDVVSNYNDATGNLGGASEPIGEAKDLLTNTITFFDARGVQGNIVSGGAIKGINITTGVGRILAGSAANGVSYNFNGVAVDGGDTLSVVPAAGKAGVKISKLTLGSVDLIQAGDGGAGAVGGSISNIKIVSDQDGYVVQAGNGGNGIAGRITGGTGGKITNIVANGLDQNESDSSANSIVEFRAGLGGSGFGAGKGGNGGAISKLYFGYETLDGKLDKSRVSMDDEVLVKAGDGGVGNGPKAAGGTGGKLTDIKVFSAPTTATGAIALAAGNGGNALDSGKAGLGGSILRVDVQNPGTSAPARLAQITVDAGDAGTSFIGAGNRGGSVTSGQFIGFVVGVTGGTGSSGTTGGVGGSLKSLVVRDGFQDVKPSEVRLDAGGGGNGTAGKGGRGGTINFVNVLNADLRTLEINQIATSANGGTSQKGAGVAGGFVSNLTITDRPTDFDLTPPSPPPVVISIRAGNGSNGGATPTGGAGGAGGAIKGVNEISSVDAHLILTGGAGGSATGKGAGGAGGGISDVSFIGTGISTVVGRAAEATIIAGNGGAGMLTMAGGAGGKLVNLGVQADGEIIIKAGDGGAGGVAGAAGRGGSVTSLLARSAFESIDLDAGDAGATGAKPGAGGFIKDAPLYALKNILVNAGDGRSGGAGGKIGGSLAADNVGFFGTGIIAAGVIPLGVVQIEGGAGSASGKFAGVGGSVTGLVGYIGSAGISYIKGGVGGGGTATKAGAGGSITDVSILGGGGVGAELRIEAGNATDVTDAKVGGAGGSVRSIGIDQLVTGTILRRVSAGDGGNTATGATGGSGGSVIGFYVPTEDIGVRSGLGFGYDTMGGIFAGAYGTGVVKNGISGSVLSVEAKSIASIVAGKPVTGSVITESNLATNVSGIYLIDNIASLVNTRGNFTNFNIANVIGGIVNPTPVDSALYPVAGPHANTFDLSKAEFIDSVADGLFGIGDTITAATDGFVAALTFNTATTSARVEAFLTLDAGLSKFVDLNNTNGQQLAP